MVNLGERRAHFRGRIERQVALTGDRELAAQGEEIAAYPTSADDPDPVRVRPDGEVLCPLKVRASNGAVLAFLGMFATFDTPFEVTTSELAIELPFPADPATVEVLRGRPERRYSGPE